MLRGLIESFKKSRRLRKVSRKLSEPFRIDNMLKKMHERNSKDSYIDELIDIAESDEYVKMVMDGFNANRQTLKTLYNKLILCGGGQYAGGHYVAASSFVFPLTLKFLLDHFDGENFSVNKLDDYNSSMFITNRLIEYFEKGEVGELD